METVIAVIIIVLVVGFMCRNYIYGVFANFFLSKILSIIFAVIGAIASIISYMNFHPHSDGGTVSTEATFAFLIPAGIALVLVPLAWMLYIGPSIFDVEWDGTVDISIYPWGEEITPRETGGFLGNLIISFVIYLVCYLMGGGLASALDSGISVSSGTEFLGGLGPGIPILIAILSAISLFRAYRNSR